MVRPTLLWVSLFAAAPVPRSEAEAEGAPSRAAEPARGGASPAALDTGLPRLEMAEEVRRRLREAVQALPAAARKRLGKTLAVRVRRTAEGDVRVFLEGAVPVPFDVQEWANTAMQGRPADAWEQLEVPL
ncbi:MAG: hypothetical protein RL653_335 [Pseudomonadota bacterium]